LAQLFGTPVGPPIVAEAGIQPAHGTGPTQRLPAILPEPQPEPAQQQS